MAALKSAAGRSQVVFDLIVPKRVRYTRDLAIRPPSGIAICLNGSSAHIPVAPKLTLSAGDGEYVIHSPNFAVQVAPRGSDPATRILLGYF